MENYHKAMDITMIKANFVEDKKATITRFLNVLNKEITNVMELQHNVELNDMVYMSTKEECRLKRRGNVQPASYLGFSST